jgi:hypothetical protein
MIALVFTALALCNLAGCVLLLAWMLSRADGQREGP